MSAAPASTASNAAAGPTPARALPFVLAGVGVAGAFALAWAAQGDDGRQTMLGCALYWLMPPLVVAWIAAHARACRAEGSPAGVWLRQRAVVIVAAAALTAAVVALVPPAMRMQFDETSLLGASRSMHADRVAMMPIGALPVPEGLVVTDWNLDKRPPLFAFLVSVVHDSVGYRVANAFVVNALALFGLLALVGARLQAAGRAVAALGMAALAGLPLLASCATSAGFEVLALALLTAAIAAAWDFVRTPTAARANTLLATALLAAHARYETLPVLLVLGVVVAVQARRWPRDRFGALLLGCAPVVLVPLALLALHGRAATFYPEAQGQPLVAVAHLADHLGPLLAALFAWGEQPFAALPNGFAAVALAAAALPPAGRRLAALVGLPVGAATGIALLWFYGDVREPTAQRLFLSAAALLALGPALLCAALAALAQAQLAGVVRTALPAALAFVAVVVGWRNLDAVAGERVLPRHAAAVMLDAVDAALAGLRPDPRRTLLVSAVAQYLIVQGHAAMTPQQFLARPPRLADGVEVVVLATPLDDSCRGSAGDVRDVLRDHAADALGDVKVSATQRVAAWRLRR